MSFSSVAERLHRDRHQAEGDGALPDRSWHEVSLPPEAVEFGGSEPKEVVRIEQAHRLRMSPEPRRGRAPPSPAAPWSPPHRRRGHRRTATAPATTSAARHRSRPVRFGDRPPDHRPLQRPARAAAILPCTDRQYAGVAQCGELSLLPAAAGSERRDQRVCGRAAGAVASSRPDRSARASWMGGGHEDHHRVLSRSPISWPRLSAEASGWTSGGVSRCVIVLLDRFSVRRGGLTERFGGAALFLRPS